MLEIDGSAHSGSGTIVRYSAALAALLGQELSITNIRAKRSSPGLRPQHLKALEAVAQLCGGSLKGGKVGASEARLHPGTGVSGGAYQWDIGTAGSTTMLLMTVLPLLAFAPVPSSLRITGGLFQDFAPSPYHMQHVLLPLLDRMGLRAELRVVKPGYVPTGGGIVEFRTRPVQQLKSLVLAQPRGSFRLWGISLASHLKQRKVSQRMAASCLEVLRAKGLDTHFDIQYEDTSIQPGADLALFAEGEGGWRMGADQAGARGRSAEAIGKYVAGSLLGDLDSGATVDRYVADQLILYAALASGTSEYIVPRVTEHVETNLWLVASILGARVKLEGQRLRIEGVGYKRRV